MDLLHSDHTYFYGNFTLLYGSPAKDDSIHCMTPYKCTPTLFYLAPIKLILLNRIHILNIYRKAYTMKKHGVNPLINVGKDGNVVFYVVDDQMRIRSYAKPKDPKTPKQLANRKLHAALNLISAQTKELRQFCYKGISTYKNSHNAFIGLHKQFVRCAKLNPDDICQNIHWSIGSRPGVVAISLMRNESQCLLQWSPGRINRISDKSARAVWVIRNLTQCCWEWNLNAGIRKDGETILNVNSNNCRDEWLLWLFFYDPTNEVFTVDKQIYVPQDVLSVSKEFDERNTSNWDLFDGIVENIVNERIEK